MEEKEDLPITFSAPIEQPLPIEESYVPFEVPLPYEEVPTEEATDFYVERPIDITPAYECFVQKQASYGLLFYRLSRGEFW